MVKVHWFEDISAVPCNQWPHSLLLVFPNELPIVKKKKKNECASTFRYNQRIINKRSSELIVPVQPVI